MGVTIQRLSPGDGKTFPRPGDIVRINCVGTLMDGKEFYSNKKQGDGRPFETKIGVGEVIKGWDEAVPQLSVGERAILIVTSDYAYGSRAFPPHIPAYADLKFEVELLDVRRS